MDKRSTISQVYSKNTTILSVKNSQVMPPRPPPPLVCKQSVPADAKDIKNLKDTETKDMFGDVDVVACIEKYVCRSMFNEENELVAFIVVRDHPNLPVMEQCRWTNWIRRTYRFYMATTWNTLFIHYLVWDVRYPNFFNYLLKSFYKTNVHLEYFILVAPPGMVIFADLELLFTPIFPKDDATNTHILFDNVQVVYVNQRISVIKKMTIRKASEEDNIDVQPLLACQYDVLKYVFGDFRLKDVIDLDNSKKCVLVAERSSGVTVGMMTVTVDIDYMHINRFFYVPLADGYSHPAMRTDWSKNTMKNTELPSGFATYEDLQVLTAQEIENLFGDQDSSSSEEWDDNDKTEDRSSLLPEIYLDEESEFRIVDPVMECLISRLRHKRSEFTTMSSVDSFPSVTSVDFTYYGRQSRGSWATNMWHIEAEEPPETFTSRKRTTTIKEPAYNGPENGFLISLFALHPDLDIRYAFDLLEASFECFPDKFYCFLQLPTDYQASPISKFFVRLTPKLSRDFPHEMYVVHKNSLFSNFNVRAVSLVDRDGIAELLENIKQGKRILKEFTQLMFEENFGNRAFVLECEDCIVGVAFITKDFQLELMEPHYKIEDVIALSQYGRENHGLLRHVVVSPLFLKAAPFFLRQIMHKTCLETLSYCMVPTNEMAKMHMSPVTVLGELTPVLPRSRVVYDLASLDIFQPDPEVLHLEREFALFITSEKLLSIPKLELNYRIVVVGASTTALSFLENLIFESALRYVKYNNVTLVSIHGLPLELPPHLAADIMLPNNGRYTRNFLARLSLHTHINILYGALTIINRKQKEICMNDEHWMRYDYLFLFTGTQFCKPIKKILKSKDIAWDIEARGCHKHEDLKMIHNQVCEDWGDNMFLVNTSADTLIALGSLKKIIGIKKSGKIVVYGTCINIYTCVESLLRFGIPGHKIVVVESPDTCKTRSIDNNAVIEKAVIDSMDTLEVTIHFGYTLVNWVLRHKYVSKVIFCSVSNAPLSVDCLAFFCFGKKFTSAKTYMAVNDSGIVYNNGIIINSKFLTNDKFIYAAGPATKYSKRFQDPMNNHEYYSSIEVGQKVSEVFRRSVEPQTAEEVQEEKDTHDTLPVMTKPLVIVARLPGGWNYVRISAPGRTMPLEAQLHGQGDSGPVLTTGDPIDPQGPGYFQLSFSVYNTVREIACLSKKEIPVQNYERLYGKHEQVLNHLYDHYNQCLIYDLYSYFDQPWAYAIYTSGFNLFSQQCADLFIHDEDIDPWRVLQSGTNISQEQEIAAKYAASSVPLYVNHLTLKYVKEHRLQLPMYFADEVLSSVKRVYSVSPLHREHYQSKSRTKRPHMISLPVSNATLSTSNVDL